MTSAATIAGSPLTLTLSPLRGEGKTTGTDAIFVSHRASGIRASLRLLLDRGEGRGEESISATRSVHSLNALTQ